MDDDNEISQMASDYHNEIDDDQIQNESSSVHPDTSLDEFDSTRKQDKSSGSLPKDSSIQIPEGAD